MPRSAAESLYTLALRALQPALPLLRNGQGKLARGIRGREEVLERMRRWSGAERAATRPLVWFHAPSVGEGLQARAVVEALRSRRPDVQVVYTYFSPSADEFARTVPADLVDYLPFDLPSEVGEALDLLRPDLLAFSKTDVWPNLTFQAERRGVRMVLLSATLPATSSRTRAGARRLLGPAYRRLTRVAAISAADAERFAAFGVPAERRTVMGDARFDQVLQRASTALGSPWPGRLRSDEHFVLVAGSTWLADEQALFRAVSSAAAGLPDLRLVIAPHEPTEEHLASTEALLGEIGFTSQRLAEVESAPARARAILVDRLGVLGDLYAAADVAYVGGGWGAAGLHSVLEPASFGAPVLFGPRHANAREAAELMAAGAAWSVRDAAELRQRIVELREDPALLRHAGDAARRYVEAGRGAAQRGVDIILEDGALPPPTGA